MFRQNATCGYHGFPGAAVTRFRLIWFLCLISTQVFGQTADTATYVSEPYWSLTVVPGAALPLINAAEIMSPGMSVDVAGEYRLLPFLYARLGLNYTLLPVRSPTGELANLLSIGVGPRLSFEVLPDFTVGPYVRGGYWFGFLTGDEPAWSANPVLDVGAQLSYRIYPSVSLGIDASYRSFFGFTGNIALSVRASYHRFFSSPGILEVSEPELRVLPILYSHYDTNPISTFTIRNATDQPVTDVRVSFFAPEYMVDPKSCSPPFTLAPNEERTTQVLALLTDRVLSVSEGTKVSSTISVDLSFMGREYRKEISQPLEIASRNAMVWDDDRKAACFVTAKDPAVLKFARTFAALLRGRSVLAFGDALLNAMILHEALSAYGMAYATDPSTPYSEYSRDRTTVDFLQFPNQTLEYKGGDCDDLSILYCALLESLGIETAFITVPGHILAAFRLTGADAAALSGFQRRSSFIVRDDGIWVPVETTSIDGGFLRAWRLGAQAWNAAVADDTAGFVPVHAAWEHYEPVGFAGAETEAGLPDESVVLARFTEELAELTKQETEGRIEELQSRIAADPEDLMVQNRLGVLYARYGMFNEALAVLGRIAEQAEFIPALTNMGSIYFLMAEYLKAEECYQKALSGEPDNTNVVLALMKVEQELENHELVVALYNRLKELDPELAEQVESWRVAEGAAERSGLPGDLYRSVQWDE